MLPWTRCGRSGPIPQSAHWFETAAAACVPRHDPMPRLGASRIVQPEQAIARPETVFSSAAVGAERLPNGGYMKLERVFLDDGARPDVLHQVVFADELAAGPNQNLEDLERAAADRNGDTTGPQLAPGQIDFPPIRRINGLLTLLRQSATPSLEQSSELLSTGSGNSRAKRA